MCPWAKCLGRWTRRTRDRAPVPIVLSASVCSIEPNFLDETQHDRDSKNDEKIKDPVGERWVGVAVAPVVR